MNWLLSLVLAATPPSALVVPGSITLVLINPPQEATCAAPGRPVVYTATGAVMQAHSATFSPRSLVLEVTPAIVNCVFVDGFDR